VPRPHGIRPSIASPRIVGGVGYRPYYRPYYYPYGRGFSLGIYSSFGYPYGYAYPYFGYRNPYYYGFGYPHGYAYPYPYYGDSYGYGSGYGYDSGVGYGYGYPGLAGTAYGGLRIQGAPAKSQVFVDGYYAGIVEDFEGPFRRLNLEAGVHRVEIRVPGEAPLAPMTFEVNIQPGQTVTYHAQLTR
jgi:hypothetical protein